MKVRRRRREPQSSIDMTPMLDIVFQLILFFLVSTTFAILPGIKLNLPTSRTSEGTSSQGITITASVDGTLFFNDKQVSELELGKELHFYETGETKKEEFPVTIEADADVTNGTIVNLFDIIRENGFAVINLRTSTDQ
ncbi:MAG: biopolymer transporter ExbD [Treponema sp.]|nr:biopolymer transporter ExbD [Treponema sp.]